MTETSFSANSHPEKSEASPANFKAAPRPDRVVAPVLRSPKSASRARLGAHTTKRYLLADNGQRTVANLRQILSQKGVPGDAAITFAEGALTLEWDE